MPALILSIAIHVGLFYLLAQHKGGGQDGDKDGRGKPGNVKVKLLDKLSDSESKKEHKKEEEKGGIVVKKDKVPPEQVKVEHKCEHFYTGIGVQSDGTRDCVLTAIPKGYPADRAGLKVGDSFIWPEGSECPGRGPEGTFIELQVRRGEKIFKVKLIREKICTSPEEK